MLRIKGDVPLRSLNYQPTAAIYQSITKLLKATLFTDCPSSKGTLIWLNVIIQLMLIPGTLVYEYPGIYLALMICFSFLAWLPYHWRGCKTQTTWNKVGSGEMRWFLSSGESFRQQIVQRYQKCSTLDLAVDSSHNDHRPAQVGYM